MADGSNKRQMSDAELLALIGQYEKESLGSPVSSGVAVGTMYSTSNQLLTTLEIDRFNALNYYMGRPFGNETENSSAVVIPELRDTVEWIKPQLMRIFAAARTPCVFDPENEDDVDQAALETEAVRHIFMCENDGFGVIHDYCMDALLLRNGYIKVYLEERKVVKVERYSGLSQDELTELLDDDKDEQIDILEQGERLVDAPQGAQEPNGPMAGAAGAPPQAQMPGMPPQIPQGMPPGQRGAPPQPMGVPGPTMPQPTSILVFDVKLRRTKQVKRIKVECVPPEEMRVSPKARSNLDSAPFIEHKTEKSRSDLILDGYDEDLINRAAAGSPRWLDMDALARDVVVDQLTVESPADFAMQTLEVRDVTIRVDFDGDGVGELRRVLIAGDIIIENEEIEEVPIASGVGKRMAHRHTGLSLYDELADIQLIKSELMRQGLNNMRLANNGRTAVDWRKCNLSDLMDSRAGGIVRTNGPPEQVLMPLTQPSNLMDQVIPTMQYVDTWREFRTGVGKDTVGIDADALQNVTKGGQLAGMAAAGLKIELIARCLAEGLKDMFLKIRALMVRHQDQPLQFQMRGKWVTVDPTQWRDRTRVSPNVGLGSGTREESRQNLMLLAQMQEKLAPLGLVGAKQAYETFKVGATLLGYEQPERFAMDPQSQEFQEWQAAHPPQPNPAVQIAQIRAQSVQQQTQADVAKAQAATQAGTAKAQAEVMHAAIQNKEDRAVDMANIDMQAFIALAKLMAPIVASQLKGDPNANAGAVVRNDVAQLTGNA